MTRSPYVIYADCEAILEDILIKKGDKSEVY